MRKFYIIILFLLCSAPFFAQSEYAANEKFQAGDYAAAQQEYGKLLRRYPSSALFAYRYARCAQEQGDYPTAISYFEKSGNRYDLKHYHLGEIYLQLGYADEAIAAYEAYLATLNPDSERMTYVKTQLRNAEKLQRYMRRVEKVEIIDSVETSVDSILAYCPLSAEVGRMSYDSLGNIVYTNQRQDRRLWGAKRDSATVLVSSHSLMGQWSVPDTLSEDVNFAEKQAYPYILNDGVTLYFAACDTNGLGGYDIYVTRYNTYTDSYTTPENVGMPFNSPANDYLMLIDEHRNIGYFATDRFSSEGRVRVYAFVPKWQKNYWRGLSQDSLVAYAQLRYVLPAQQVAAVEMAGFEPASKPDTVFLEEVHEAIFFVLNDSVAYTMLADFRHSDAKKKYQEWQALERKLADDAQRLTALRQSYSQADDTQRSELAPVILHLEQEQSHDQMRSRALLREIRQIEMSAQ